MATKKPTIPKAIGAAADKYYEVREARLQLERQADAMREFEGQLREHLINNIPKSKSTGVAGKLCRVSVVTDDVAQVQDWDKFYAYITKNAKSGGFALLNRAVNGKAVKELWDAKKKVPGVVPFTVTKLSLNKL